MEYPCIEMTVDIETDFHCVRLWINVTKEPADKFQIVHAKDINEIQGILRGYKAEVGHVKTLEQIRKYCETIDNLNAFQFQTKIESGMIKYGKIFYTVDFDNHG